MNNTKGKKGKKLNINIKKIIKKKTNTKGTTKPKDPKRKAKILKTILLVFLIMCILGLCAIGIFLGYIVKNAPEFSPSALYDAEPTIVYDKNGNEAARLGEKIRSIVTYDQLPQTLIDAIVATEDSRFFQHNGFDVPRFVKATLQQLIGKSDAGGASTLTMQISKNKLTKKDSSEDSRIQSFLRKFTDIYMAVFKIEKSYTKEEIIEFYVNSNYMGAGTNGVEDASQVYFGKSVSDLSLAEAAMITGIFNAPNYYDPYINPEACEQRRETVLYLMRRHGYINEDEYNAALKLTVDKLIKPEPENKNEKYQSFIFTVVDEVIKKTGYNPYQTPMKIYTTMDPDMQEHIDKLLTGNLDSYVWENDKVQAGIAVLSAKDGSIAAIGAGRNRAALGYNMAVDTKRQIGSTAKPLYEYGLGIEKLNWSTGKIFVDEPWGYTGLDTEIKNWDFKYKGFISIRDALVDSTNIPALKAFQSIDNDIRVPWIESLGLHPEMEDGLIHEAHALGGYNGESPLSMAAAYNAFASGGYYVAPYCVTKIEFNDGSNPYEYKYAMDRVMSEETAWMVTNILIDVAKENFKYVNGVTYAGKSGTTNLSEADLREWNLTDKDVADLWAVGFTDKYTIGTWYGYESLEDGHNRFASGQNYRLFQAVAKGVFTEQSEFKKPDGVIAVEIEKGCYEECLPSEFTPKDRIITEYFKKGYEPTTVSDRFAKLENVSNLEAKVIDNNVVLSWDKITTPHAIDMDYLNAYFGNAYQNEKYPENAENAAIARFKENTSILGTIVYKVYEQVGDNLILIKTTDDNTVSVKATKANPTYVVKTSYTVFEDNMSDGESIKVNDISVGNPVVATLKNKNVTAKVGATKINDEENIAIVTENGIMVDKSKVSYQYALDTSKKAGDTYSTSVKVIYDKSLIDTFTINVTVKN